MACCAVHGHFVECPTDCGLHSSMRCREHACMQFPHSACCPVLCVCRATGGPGVVGSIAASGDLDFDGQGHIEVCCTAHTNPGVRSLVKSVIRGLKVRVPLCNSYSTYKSRCAAALGRSSCGVAKSAL